MLVLLAISMILGGTGKLAGVQELHVSFKSMSLPAWFGYLIGLLEVVAGIALVFNSYRSYAALTIAPIMVGAAYYHLIYQVPSALPALIFLILSLYFFASSNSQSKWPIPLLARGALK